MNREQENQAAMFSRPQEVEGLTLQPFTMAIAQILEDRGNRFANGKNFTPKMSEVNELMFVMCHDVATLLAIPEADWRKEVILFASCLTPERINAIQSHCEAEIGKVNSSAVKPAGKAQAAGRGR